MTATATPTPTAAPSITPSPTVTLTPTASATPGVEIADPYLTKRGSLDSAAPGDTVVYTITVGNHGPANARDVVVSDPLPEFLDVVSVSVSPALAQPPSISRRLVIARIPVLTPADRYVITITTRVNTSTHTEGGHNTAALTSGTGDTVTSNNQDSAPITILPEDADLPDTGFAENRVTYLAEQPAEKAYAALGGLWLEIPGLGVQQDIVGVPVSADGWDVTWLGKDAGYLEGSAFPTWKGNSVIAAHVTLASGKPGPFARLGKLAWGNTIIIHGWGQRYVYEVRSVTQVDADDTSVMGHQEATWLTLITCQQYNAKLGAYEKRLVVRAVLVKIE